MFQILVFIVYNKMNEDLKTFLSYMYLITCLFLHRKLDKTKHSVIP